MSIVGANGMNTLLGYLVVRDLQAFVKSYMRNIMTSGDKSSNNNRNIVNTFKNKIGNVNSTDGNTKRIYSAYVSQLKKERIWDFFRHIILSVGQKQIIRKQINSILSFNAKLESKMYVSNLSALNDALLHDVKSHYRKPTDKPYPTDDNPLLGV